MARAGQMYENPVTGERMFFHKTAYETGSTLLDIEFWVEPNSQAELAEHIHPYFAEQIEIIEGFAHYRVGKTELPASEGDTVTLPQNVAHIHPWNMGKNILHWRKITQFDRPEMEMLLSSAGFFESLYALAQQGKVRKNGLPKNLLQTVVLLHALEPSAYVAGFPIWLQRPLFGLLAALGRAMGYKPYYSATSTSIERSPVTP